MATSPLNIQKDFLMEGVKKDLKLATSRPEFFEKVVREAGHIHIDNAEELTLVAKDPMGNPYEPLSPTYRRLKQDEVGSSKPDLRFDDVAMESLYVTEGRQNREAKIRFKQGGDYMYEHQRGIGKPQRKVFAEKTEQLSAPQQANHKKVGQVLARYLNQPRVTFIG